MAEPIYVSTTIYRRIKPLEKKILKLLEQNKGTREIGEELGVSYMTAATYAEIVRRGLLSPEEALQAQASRIEELHKQGLTLMGIAIALKIPRDLVAKYCRENLEDRRKDNSENEMAEAKRVAMRDLRDKGMSLQSIGEQFGVSGEAVRQALLRIAPNKVLVRRTTEYVCKACGDKVPKPGASPGVTKLNRDQAEALMKAHDTEGTWEAAFKKSGITKGKGYAAHIVKRNRRLFTKEEQNKYNI